MHQSGDGGDVRESKLLLVQMTPEVERATIKIKTALKEETGICIEGMEKAIRGDWNYADVMSEDGKQNAERKWENLKLHLKWSPDF